MLAQELIERYQAFCPPTLSMEGDVSGLQIGTLNKSIRRVMVALDIRETTVAEAIDKQVDLIIVKHAPIFKPLKDLVADNPATQILLQLVRHNIAVYVSHTDIDVVDGGLNDWFCEKLGIAVDDVLHETQSGLGIGRVGTIAEQTAEEFAHKVKEAFHLKGVRLVAYPHHTQKLIRRVAICGGSGGSFYPDAIEKRADLYVTGDIYYHTGQDMLTRGLLAIDPGHHVEVLFVKKVADLLRTWSHEFQWGIEIIETSVLTNPFQQV